MRRRPLPLMLASALLASACNRGGKEGASGFFVEIGGVSGFADPPPRWPDGTYRIVEITPGGLALFDADGDGDLDLFVPRYPPPGKLEEPAPDQLFRQEPSGRFVEVAGAGGLADPGFGCGVALGDIDEDGDLDVYVANLGVDSLFRNEGGGRFSDVSAASGIAAQERGWSSCAAFLDYDRDGDLDLYVSHYLEDDPSRVCREREDAPRDYCGPARYQGVADQLFRNRGPEALGTFEDVSVRAGLRQALPGFAVIPLDFTGDGWVDIFVANDMKPNQLYVNRGDGRFSEEALERGCAVNGAGAAEANMGVAVGDLNGDSRLDIFVTHLVDQTNTLYLSAADPQGRASFRDRSASSGLGGPSLRWTAWGCAMEDFDHDGDLDLAVVNGRIARGPILPGAEAAGDFWSAYAEPNQLFLNLGEAGSCRFAEANAEAGAFCRRAEVGRGLAAGDLDGDGDLDLVQTNLGASLRLYRNDAPRRGTHWLKVRARSGPRDALGAVVRVRAAGQEQIRPILSATSYAAAVEPTAHFGLGAAAAVEWIEVTWPSGQRERFAGGAGDRLAVVREGESAAK